MGKQVLSEIYQVPRIAAGLSVVCCLLWYRSDGTHAGLWSCLLALAVFAGVNEAVLALLSSRARGTSRATARAPKRVIAVLKALGATSGTMSSLFSAMLVTITIMAFLATFARTVLPVRSQNWWQCISVALMALNTVAALPSTLLLASCRWSRGLELLAPDVKSSEKLLNSLYTSSIILDSGFLDRQTAAQELEWLKQAQIQVLIVESRDGPDAEQAMSKTILLGEDGKSLPLLVKLRTVLEAKETADHPCRDVYILLNDAPVAVVSGIHTASEIEQLCHLSQLDYGRSTAVFASDERMLQAASQAAIAIVPASLQEQYSATSLHCVGVCTHSDTPSSMLPFLAQATWGPRRHQALESMQGRACKESVWKAAAFAMVMTVLYAAPSLISIGLGLPLLLPPVRLLVLCGAAYAGAVALALEPGELDLMQKPYSHIFRGIPSEAATDRDVMAGRWVSSLMQCMLLSCAACMIAVTQTLKDAGCGSLGAVFGGMCDVHAAAQQTIRMAVPLPEGGWGGEAEVGWEGTILEAVQGVIFCMLLALTGWMLLVHKTHRVAMFNALARDRALVFSPSTALFLLYTCTALGLAFSRSVRLVLGIKRFVPLYAMYMLPVVAFVLLESEMRKYAVIGQCTFYSRHPLHGKSAKPRASSTTT